jgi:hypothetical protein
VACNEHGADGVPSITTSQVCGSADIGFLSKRDDNRCLSISTRETGSGSRSSHSAGQVWGCLLILELLGSISYGVTVRLHDTRRSFLAIVDLSKDRDLIEVTIVRSFVTDA